MKYVISYSLFHQQVKVIERETGKETFIKFEDLLEVIEGLQEIQNLLERSILEVLCICPSCNWTGRVYDCEPDVDGDGSLGCPNCLTIVNHEGD